MTAIFCYLYAVCAIYFLHSVGLLHINDARDGFFEEERKSGTAKM